MLFLAVMLSTAFGGSAAWAGLSDGGGGETNPGDKDSGEPRGRVVASAEVGTLAGGVSVNAGGGLSWATPLDFAGEVGSTGLSLSYSADGGTGVAGIGWSLGGVSTVSRCSSTQAIEGHARGVQLDAGDALCLDDERLVLVDGTHGADGAVYAFRADNGSRVILHGDVAKTDSWFELAGIDGSRTEFGNGEHAVVAGDGAPLQWWASRERDLAGNETAFRYTVGGSGDGQLAADHRLASVSFGANPKAGVKAWRVTHFDYWPWGKVRAGLVGQPWKEELGSGFVSGQRFSRSTLLARVRFEVRGVAAGEVRVGYEGESVKPNVPRPTGRNRYRVAMLERCDAAGACLPATEFSWQSTHDATVQRDDVAFAGEVFDGDPEVAKAKHSIGRAWGDFDGDGDTDLVSAAEVNSSSQWEFWEVDMKKTQRVSTDVPVGFAVPWRAELSNLPSRLREHVAPPVQTVRLGGDAADELLVGRATTTIANVGQLPPYGLGRKTDRDAEGTPSGELDARRHPGILDDLEVVQRDSAGHWSRSALGWAKSKRAGHKLLWFQAGDFNADGRDDVMVCASRVDFDDWYAEHGKEKSFDPNGQDPFLVGHLRYALADADGKLSLANGGAAVGGKCGYDDWRYGLSSTGDNRAQVAMIPAREVDGRFVALDERSESYRAWTWEKAGWKQTDTGLPADTFMRLRGSGRNTHPVFDPETHKEVLAKGQPRWGFGLGDARAGDFNGDGMTDLAFVELPKNTGSSNTAYLDSGLGVEDKSPEGIKEAAEVQLYYATGKGFKASTRPLLWFERPWDWLLQFAGGSTAADVNGDGSDDLGMVSPDLDVEKNFSFNPQTQEWEVGEEHTSGQGMVFYGGPEGIDGIGDMVMPLHLQQWSLSQVARDYAMVPLDLNADGMLDFAQFDAAKRTFSFVQTQADGWWGEPDSEVNLPGDRIVGIVDGDGAHTKVDYAPASSPIVSEDQQPALKFPIRGLAGEEPVVARLHTDTGLDKDGTWVPKTTEYRYGDRRVDLIAGQGGPRTQTATTVVDTPSGKVSTQTTSRFDQTTKDPATGAYPLSGVPLSQVTVTRNLSDAQAPVRVLHEASAWSFTTTVKGAYRRQVDRAYRASWDLDAGAADKVQECLITAVDNAAACVPDKPLASAVTAYGHDQHGNVTDESVSHGDGETTAIKRSFENHTGLDDLTIGLLRSQTTWSQTEAGAEYRTVEHSYDDRHLLRETIVEPKRPKLRVTTSVKRNAVGRVVDSFRQAADMDKPQLIGHVDYDPVDLATPVASVNAKGQKTTTTWHPQCLLASAITDPAGRVTVGDVDGFCRVTGSQRFAGGKPLGPASTTKLERIEDGPGSPLTQITTSIQDGGHSAITRTDRVGQLLGEQVAGFGGDRVVHNRYDALGRSRATSTPARPQQAPAGWSDTRFDHLGRPVQVTDAKGAKTVLEYKGRTVRVTDPKGRESYKRADEHGRVVQSGRAFDEAAKTEPWCFTYGAFSTLIKAKGCGSAYAKLEDRIQYDALGRVIRHTSPQSGTGETVHDALGRVVETTDATGAASTFSYDALDRVLTQTDTLPKDQGTAVTSYAYDEVPGELHSATRVAPDLTTEDPDDQHKVVDSFAFDQLKRPSGVTRDIDGTKLITTTSYDAKGRLAAATMPTIGQAQPLVVKRGYDAHDHLDRVSIPSVNVDLDLDVWTAKSADTYGTLTEQTWFNGTTSESETDPLTGLRDSTVTRKGNTHVATNRWKWEPDGNLEERHSTTQAETNVESFTYDAADRLRAWSTSRPDESVQDTEVGFDPIGNVVTSPAGAYDYDPDTFRLTTVTDAKGTVSTFGYDAAGKMTSRTTIAQGEEDPQAHTMVRYDPSGRVGALTAKGKDTPERSTAFVYAAGGEVAMEKTSDGTILSLGATSITTATAPKKPQTVIATTLSAGHGPVARHTTTLIDDEKPQTELAAIHPGDPLGTVTDTTDKAGAPTHTHFDPWGRATDPQDWTKPVDLDDPDPTTVSPKTGYTGHDANTIAGLIVMGPRLYDPAVGRFMQIDTATTDPSNGVDYNRYVYTRGNPTRYSDPSGHNPQPHIPQHTDLPGPGIDLSNGGSQIGGDPIVLWDFMFDSVVGVDAATDRANAGAQLNPDHGRPGAGHRSSELIRWSKQTTIPGTDITFAEGSVRQMRRNEIANDRARREIASYNREVASWDGGGAFQVGQAIANSDDSMSVMSVGNVLGFFKFLRKKSGKPTTATTTPESAAPEPASTATPEPAAAAAPAPSRPGPGVVKRAGKKGEYVAGFKKTDPDTIEYRSPAGGTDFWAQAFDGGEMSVALYRRDKGGFTGKQLFRMAVRRLQPTSFRALWLSPEVGRGPDNWRAYQRGATQAFDGAAAARTWSGQRAAECGFTCATVVTDTYDMVEVVFTRPGQ